MTHPIIFRSYGACPIILGPIVYKHFVPTGLRPFSMKLFHYHGNTLTQQDNNAYKLCFKRRACNLSPSQSADKEKNFD